MGLKLYVNDEVVWESDGDYKLVTSISCSTIRGEFGKLGVANDIDRVDFAITVRDEIEAMMDLDIREARERSEQSGKIEDALKARDGNKKPVKAVSTSDSKPPSGSTDARDATVKK